MARKTIEKNIAYDDERKLYYVTLVWGVMADGKYKKTTRTTSNKKEAKQILKEHQKAMAAGTAVVPVKETLVDAVEALQYKELDRATTTIYGYRNILKNHIQPFFKDTPIQSVTVQMLQEFRVNEIQKGLDDNSVSKYFALLYSVFKDACNKDIIAKNHVTMMERISPKKAERAFMNTGEIAELCKSVAGTKLELPVTLAVYLGLRRGEICGLRWSDIDFEVNVLRITKGCLTVDGGFVPRSILHIGNQFGTGCAVAIPAILWRPSSCSKRCTSKRARSAKARSCRRWIFSTGISRRRLSAMNLPKRSA